MWTLMCAQPRWLAASLTSAGVPKKYGVYAWFKDAEPMYAGRAVGAQGLHERIWRKHLASGADLSRSSFRRNVCQYLGIADTSVTKVRPSLLAAEDVQPVNAWIRQCEVAWIEFDSVANATEFERQLLSEWMPPLSYR